MSVRVFDEKGNVQHVRLGRKVSLVLMVRPGDKIWFKGEAQCYTVRVRSDRYVICTKSMNVHATVVYTIIDIQEKERGPEDTIFGYVAETDMQCREMLIRLEHGNSAISRRNKIPLDITDIRRKLDAR